MTKHAQSDMHYNLLCGITHETAKTLQSPSAVLESRYQLQYIKLFGSAASNFPAPSESPKTSAEGAQIPNVISVVGERV